MYNDVIWRDTALFPRFFIIDARCLIPILFWMIHARAWTFYLTLGAIAFFACLEWYGISPEVALRIARLWMTGRVRPVSDRYTFRRRARW